MTKRIKPLSEVLDGIDTGTELNLEDGNMSKDKPAMTMHEAMGFLAQGVINITENHTTIMPTSKIHEAMTMIATPMNSAYLTLGAEMVGIIKDYRACLISMAHEDDHNPSDFTKQIDGLLAQVDTGS